jgi:hypothetical protein
MSFQEKVFATEDLKRHIYSFGYSGHRQQMRFVCDQLKRNEPSRYGKELLTRVPYYYFQASKKDATSKEILNELVWFFQLNRCRCCSRHSHHKPSIILDPPYGYLFLEGEEKSVPEDKFVGDCNCRCRRMMRCGIDHFMNYRKL